MTNVQSVITPTTNGAAPPVFKGKTSKAKISVASGSMTALQACDAAFEYGSSMAGLDGNLTKALQAFSNNETVKADMLTALNVGYVVRKLGVDKARATEIVGLLKYNEKKQDDHHRTFEQQRVMDSVRVIWHRAQKMAGIVQPKSDNQVKAEQTRAQKEAEKTALESRLIKADEIVNPKDDVDVFESLTRLVSTMKALQSKHAAKLVGDRGSAWRDWLASAPKA